MCGGKQLPTGGLSLFFLIVGPVLGVVLFFTLKSLGWGSDACWTAAVSAVCAVWWVFEPVPIPVTSLLPFALFPVLGVLSPREISESYGAPLILLLLGGFILSTAMASSGALSGLAVLDIVLIMAVICLAITFLTELTSNTATTTLMMPILAATAMAIGIEPALLMVPAAMSASCAFMLPVATAPNVVVFSTGAFPTKVMAREGLALNFIGALLITAVCAILL